MLEIIDILCTVTQEQAELIRDMSIQLEQAKIADEVLGELKEREKHCNDALDTVEYKLRRYQ